jgi:hypothetical protein
MEPPPDYGEESYKGLGRRLNCGPLITGGDSGVGRAADEAIRGQNSAWRCPGRGVTDLRTELVADAAAIGESHAAGKVQFSAPQFLWFSGPASLNSFFY